MATTQDASLTFIEEVTYKTNPGATTRALEFVDESLDFKKNVKQGKGLRVGGRVARSGRRVVPTADGDGDITFELLSKGQGLLYKWALGALTHGLVSAATYQGLATLADLPASFVTQKGTPEVGGTVDASTYLGCMVAAVEFDFPNADIPTAKLTLDMADLGTATGYAAPSYAAAPTLYHFGGLRVFTGTLTAPTATTLASATTELLNVRSGSLKIDHNLSMGRQNSGGAGRKAKPTVGLRDIGGKLTTEYDSTTLRDAMLADSPMCLIFQYQGAALGVGNETLQFILPEVKITSPTPNANGTDLITTDYQFDVLDNLTAAQPIWVAYRSADTAP